MITIRKKTNRISKDWIVADIENRSDGSVLAIDTYDGTNHHTVKDWNEWLNYIGPLSRKDRRYRTIYAHNGGGWDWLSLIEYLIAKESDVRFSAICVGSKLIAVTLVFKGRYRVKLVDSLSLLRCSLDSAAKTYIGKGKVDTDGMMPEKLYDTDMTKFLEYLHNDTEILHSILSKFSDLIYSKVAPIGTLGITLPSTALRCFQTAYLKREIYTPTNTNTKAFLRKSYFGGRVETFKPGYYERIYVYDFNSLYPSVMVDTPVPVSARIQQTSILRPNKCGFYDITFNQGNRGLLPILLSKGTGVYSGRGVYCINEIRRLIDMADGKVTVHSGIVFCESGVIFKEYVDTLYSLRLTDRSGPIGDTCKLLLNSLYGKFAQKPERNRVLCCDYDELKKHRDSGSKIDVISEEIGLYKITEDKPAAFEHVGIASTITSEARGRLWESFNIGTVYCDTDSIHTTNQLETDSNRLGCLKLEFSGEGVYCGKKLYALRNDDTEKLRVKGVSIGGRNGMRLDFDSLHTLIGGAKIKCTFSSPNTPNRVLRGGKACIFESKSRTIRNTANAR